MNTRGPDNYKEGEIRLGSKDSIKKIEEDEVKPQIRDH